MKETQKHLYNPSLCLQHLPAEGITLFQGLLHAHLLGTAINLRHGRDGKELPPVMQGKF